MKSVAAHLPSMSPEQETADARGGKYLCFRLGKEDFAIQVSRVREIMPMQPLTVVPQTPAHMKGVMNLRGKLIPVIDLKSRLGLLETGPASPRNSIVVVHVDKPGGRVLIGIMVDNVSEVLTLKGAQIEDPPPYTGTSSSACLIGVTKIKGRPRSLLDLNHALTEAEIERIEEALAQPF